LRFISAMARGAAGCGAGGYAANPELAGLARLVA
jgi:hypothetical protein